LDLRLCVFAQRCARGGALEADVQGKAVGQGGRLVVWSRKDEAGMAQAGLVDLQGT
jgi:hypothetical protein